MWRIQNCLFCTLPWYYFFSGRLYSFVDQPLLVIQSFSLLEIVMQSRSIMVWYMNTVIACCKTAETIKQSSGRLGVIYLSFFFQKAWLLKYAECDNKLSAGVPLFLPALLLTKYVNSDDRFKIYLSLEIFEWIILSPFHYGYVAWKGGGGECHLSISK